MMQKESGHAIAALTGMLLAVSLVGCNKSDPGANGAPVGNGSAGESSASPRASAGDTTGGPSGAKSREATRRRGRVVLLGTSLTAGLGLSPDVAYPALLQQKVDSAGFPLTIVSAGLSGETSAGALRRAEWVLDQAASLVVLEVGANDGLRGVDPDSTRANLVALIETVRRIQPTARVVLVQMEAPTNLGRSYTTRFHDAYVQAAKETGIELLPFLLDGVAGEAALNQSDGIHPNARGSLMVAETMWSGLLPIFAELRR